MLIWITSTENGFARTVRYSDGSETSDVAPDVGSGVHRDAEVAFTGPIAARTIGNALYAWLFGAAGQFVATGGGAEAEPLYLHFDRAGTAAADRSRLDALAALPWELLCSHAGTFVARGGGGVVRVRSAAADPAARAACCWPLRVVAVSGSASDGDDERLALSREVQTLRELLVRWGRSVNLETIESASSAALSRAIVEDCPTVLHFCGHATHIPGLAPSLQTAGVGATLDAFSIDDIGNLGAPAIDLVVLNACKSTLAPGQSPATIWQQSLAEAFLTNGAKAVVAMQADIRGEPARVFAAAFHAAWLEGWTMEAALAAARAAMPLADPAWAMPVLTLAHLPGPGGVALFDPKRRVRQPIEFVGDGPHSYRFTANFHAQRRALANWLVDQSRVAAPKGPLVLMTGEAGTGKSHILKWSLSNVAYLGYQLRYIDFAAFPPHRDGGNALIDLLRAVRDGSAVRTDGASAGSAPGGSPPLCLPLLPAGVFEAFNTALNTYLDPSRAGAGVDAPAVDLFHPPLGDAAPLVGGAPFNDYAAALMHAALRQSSAHGRIFVALDIGAGGARFEETEFRPFLDKVIIPELEAWQRGRAADPPIRFVICCQRETRDGLLARLDRWGRFEADLPYQPPLIDFPALPAGTDIARYATEMYWFRQKEGIASLISALPHDPAGPRIGLCSELTDLLAQPNRLVEPIWRAITDERDGVGFMQ